jgi:hypothetical protein
VQAEACGEVLHFQRGKCLGEDIGNHVVGGAIYEVQSALLHHPTDPMVAHVNVLRAHVILVVARERNHGLIVGEQGDGVGEGAEKFREEALEPEALLHAMCSHDILALHHGKRDDFLAF